MGQTGVRDIGEARVPVVSEAQLADHLRSRGQRVVVHRGRHWRQLRRGFYRPVHDMARLSAAEATCPTPFAWGFQARLAEQDAASANASIPTHLVSDLGAFDEAALPKSRRRALRTARQRARLVELTGPDLLLEQGLEVLRSAHERTGYGRLPASQEEYRASLPGIGHPAAGVVLAGIVDGRLGGYLTGHAVDGTAYAVTSVVATWAMRSGISAGLYFEFVLACLRSGDVREVVDGLHAREDEGLCRSKELLGIPLQHVPARLTMVPGAASLLRRRNPHSYYRLSGRG